MKSNRGISFKQVLRLAKKTYKKDGAKSRKNGRSRRNRRQHGGSGMAGKPEFASTAEEIKP